MQLHPKANIRRRTDQTRRFMKDFMQVTSYILAYGQRRKIYD